MHTRTISTNSETKRNKRNLQVQGSCQNKSKDGPGLKLAKLLSQHKAQKIKRSSTMQSKTQQFNGDLDVCQSTINGDLDVAVSCNS